MKKIVYIAGPFRGETSWEMENNIRIAEVTGLIIAKGGMIPLIPHTMYRFYQGTLPDAFWLQATLQLLGKADALLLISDWEKSTGALAEKAQAEYLGMPVFDDFVSLKDWADR